MKPTAKQRAGALLALVLLPLLLIMLVDHDQSVDTGVVSATQASQAIPFKGELNLLREPTTTTTTIPPTTTTVYIPPTTTTTVAPPVTAPVPVEPAPQGWSANWDAVAQCESGGNWSINTGNGYYGGLQMDMQFWSSYSTKDKNGEPIAARPDLASKAEQIRAAERAYQTRGLSPWPNCGKYG